LGPSTVFYHHEASKVEFSVNTLFTQQRAIMAFMRRADIKNL
jgi:hypothetical protein